MRSLLRRMVLLTLAVLALMTLVAPSAHASHYRRVRCGYFTPAFVIPTSTGNIIVYRDDCGYERERFEPYRRFRYFDDPYYDDYNDGNNYTVIFNNF